MTSTTYEELAAGLGRSGAGIGAAACHGTVTGLACSASGPGRAGWGGVLGEGDVPEHELRWLDRLHGEVAGMLAATDMRFEPLLPDDEAPLRDRADALAQWCEGFLSGLAEGVGAGRLPDGDVAEVVEDFTELTRAAHEGEDTEEGEGAWVEVTEFVRVGVQLVYEELRASAGAARPSPDGAA